MLDLRRTLGTTMGTKGTLQLASRQMNILPSAMWPVQPAAREPDPHSLWGSCQGISRYLLEILKEQQQDLPPLQVTGVMIHKQVASSSQGGVQGRPKPMNQTFWQAQDLAASATSVAVHTGQ